VVTLYVLDTSVFTRLHEELVHAEVDSLPPDELARSSVTDLELGHSARNAKEWDAITAMLSVFVELPLSGQIVERARAVQRLLADRGLRGRKVPDLLIAATADLAGATVLHYDQDFALIASVTGQAHRWVVPRGTID
jgi:predicted nucleic acid-binding protein